MCLMSVLAACVAHAPRPSGLPLWVKNPPASNEAFYAIGQGISLYEAEHQARLSMAAQMQVKVSDYMQTRTIVDGRFHRDYFDQTTSVTVSAVSLSQARAVEQSQSGLDWYVLLKLDRAGFVEQQRLLLDEDLRVLQAAMNLRDAPSFRRWWRLRQQMPAARRAWDNVLLVNSLTPGESIEVGAGQKQILDRYFSALQASEQVVNFVLSDQSQVKGLAAVLDQQLADAGLARNSQTGRNTAQIALATDLEVTPLGREFHVVRVLYLRLLAQGQVMAQTQIKAKGVGLGSRQQGIQVADRKLLEQAQQQNLVTQLFQPLEAEHK